MMVVRSMPRFPYRPFEARMGSICSGSRRLSKLRMSVSHASRLVLASACIAEMSRWSACRRWASASFGASSSRSP